MTAVEFAAHSGASVLAGAHVPKRPQCWRPAARSGVWDHSAIVASWTVTMVLHAGFNMQGTTRMVQHTPNIGEWRRRTTGLEDEQQQRRPVGVMASCNDDQPQCDGGDWRLLCTPR